MPRSRFSGLSRRLDLFKGGRDVDPRQQTLRATIEWSYDLLTPEEQQLFVRLSVFAGGCTLEAAEDIAGANLDTLQSLVEQSLLRRSDGRYWMLETIRDYASSRLHEAGYADKLRSRHASYYAEGATRSRDLLAAGQAETQASVSAEDANYEASLEWAERTDDSRIVFAIVWGLCEFWIGRGRFREGQRRAEWVIEAAAKTTREESIWGLTGAARLLQMSGRVDEAAGLMREDILPAFRLLGEDRLVAATLGSLAEITSYQGEHPRARELITEALEIAHRLDRPHDLAQSFHAAGGVEFQAAEFAEARRYYEEALALYQQEGGLLGEAKAELQIGECANRLQQLDAREHLQHALVCLRDLAERSSLPETLEELAAAHLEKRPSAAATLLGSAERLRSEIGAPRWEPTYYEETLHRVRTVLGDAFGDAWAEGLTMDEEAVLEYALSIG